MSAEENQPSVEAGEKQLCISCTEPNEVDAHFCKRCGAPLSPFAMINPFESLFAEGYIYRRAAEEPRRLITVLGIWVLFGVPGLTCLVLMPFGNLDLSGNVMLGSMPFFSLAMIWRTTRNYLRWKKVPLLKEEA